MKCARIMVAVSILAGLCAGQACTGPAPLTDPERLEVTDTLREACAAYSDDSIDAMITIIEEDRLSGASKADVLLAISDTWQLASRPEEYRACALAVIRQVYGQ
jgi:hypothetical protein